MFCEDTARLCAVKIEDTLKDDKISDLDYIRNLQTLIIVKNAAEETAKTAV